MLAPTVEVMSKQIYISAQLINYIVGFIRWQSLFIGTDTSTLPASLHICASGEAALWYCVELIVIAALSRS